MKKFQLILLLFLTIPIYSQIYTQSDFNLSENVQKVSVLCYNLIEEDGEIVESFPYSISNSYKTDLNLHYLEFNEDGYLKKSKLFYPRDFYGQFSLLPPIFDLESSDFGGKINYLSKSYRYSYEVDDDIIKVKLKEQNNTEINLLMKDDFMKEDEYYYYTLTGSNEKTTLSKKRKDTTYGYRRIEETVTDSKTVRNEYINNRFLVSKELIIDKEGRYDRIKVSQTKINLEKEIYNDQKLKLKTHKIELNWRNKFVRWPDIDFDENFNFDTYIKSLQREYNESITEYTYDNENKLTEKLTYTLTHGEKSNIVNETYIYDDNGRRKRHQVNDGYREYEYDEYGNWYIKTVGSDKPEKKYVRTITYKN